MTVVKRRGYVWTVAWLAGSAVGALALGVAATNVERGTAAPSEGTQPKLNPALMYLGNATCGGTCHAGEAKNLDGQMIGDEKSIYDRAIDADPAGDPHNNAFKTLTENEKSKAIAAAAKIDDASKSDRCVSCHAMPAAKKGPKYGSLADNAVGCETCHGPYEKAMDPHQKKGWAAGLRAKGDAAFAAEGIHDTRNLATRGAGCVACHLALDKDLIDAGHPELRFEMWFYNIYKQRDESKSRMHWTEQKDKTQSAKIWAVGQLASAKAAAANVAHWKDKKWDTAKAEALAKLFADGAAIVKTQFGTDDPSAFYAANGAGKELDAGKIKAALADLVKLGGTYKEGADNAANRSVISTGVEALVRSLGAKPEKPVAKTKAGGADWMASLEAMAAMAK